MLNNALKRGYRFIGFESFEDTQTFNLKNVKKLMKKSILLRHDVDGDLSAAAEMARLENKLGISSTYFLMWRSPCYNLMSRVGQDFVDFIIKSGHKIGLHYDQGYDAERNIPRHTTEIAIQREASWLEELLKIRVHAISFHQPSPALLQEGINCGKRINTYDKHLLSNYKYISDSNRIFPLWLSDKPKTLSYIDAIANCWPQSMQILIHPMWWVYDKKTTNEVWNLILKNNLRLTEQQLLATERAFGMKRKYIIREDSDSVKS